MSVKLFLLKFKKTSLCFSVKLLDFVTLDSFNYPETILQIRCQLWHKGTCTAGKAMSVLADQSGSGMLFWFFVYLSLLSVLSIIIDMSSRPGLLV